MFCHFFNLLKMNAEYIRSSQQQMEPFFTKCIPNPALLASSYIHPARSQQQSCKQRVKFTRMFYAETLPCKAKKPKLPFSQFQGRTVQPAWLSPCPLPLQTSSRAHENKKQLQILLAVKLVQCAPPCQQKQKQTPMFNRRGTAL